MLGLESVAAFPEVHAGPGGPPSIVLVAATATGCSHAATAANPIQCMLLPALAASGHLPCSTALSGLCMFLPGPSLLA